MNTPVPEGSQPIYGEDITLNDVAKINAFLAKRTSRSAKAERGSDERQVARSLRAVQSHLVSELEHGRQFANSPKASFDLLEGLRVQIRSALNALWAMSSPWQSHPDYDAQRWRHIKFWDADDEVHRQALLAEVFDRKEADRRLSE
ncbi:hypothetical protein [Streptomyces sp. NPDC046976]|uniref:hypothetical protein n=1 Tax=Streptomyces sp. NPDC046976 TaxID=3155258 RepID=UPI0033F6CB69